jgi:hypothetical protein
MPGECRPPGREKKEGKERDAQHNANSDSVNAISK